MIELQIHLGTHSLRCSHEGETLIVYNTWHHSYPILNWTLGQLDKWSEACADDTDYIKAERDFGLMATGILPILYKD